MNFHIAICDDELSIIQHIEYLVEKWGKSSGHLLKIEKYPSSEAFLFHYAEDKSYDILLLDIEMSGINGVELARKIRESNREVQIIFITGYMDYIIQGYDVEALHYLMKPVNEEKLYSVLNKAAERLKKQEKVLLLFTDGEMVRIPLYEIEYISVDKNYTTIHGKNNYTIKRTLTDIETELDPRFYRVGRSYIVNLQSIKKITRREIFLKSGTSIPLSRNHYEPLNRAMIKYF